MPEAGFKIRVKNPVDPGLYIDLPCVAKWQANFSQGEIFDLAKYEFETEPRNEKREVEVKEVTHKFRNINGEPPGPDDSPDDEDQKVEVERIKKFTVKHGREDRYRNETWEKLETVEDEIDLENEHEVRIKGKDAASNCWIDVRRRDKVPVNGLFYDRDAGRYVYQKRILTLDWSDEEDFDDADVEVREIEPPYPFDPFQDIVNVKWEERTLTAGWSTIIRFTMIMPRGGAQDPCSPVAVFGDSVNGISFATTAYAGSWDLVGPTFAGTNLPGASVTGTPSVSSSGGSVSPWTFGPPVGNSLGGQSNALSASVPVQGHPCVASSGSEICVWPSHSPNTGFGFFGQVYTVPTTEITSINVDASGITASVDGYPFDLISGQISWSSFGFGVTLFFKPRPP